MHALRMIVVPPLLLCLATVAGAAQQTVVRVLPHPAGGTLAVATGYGGDGAVVTAKGGTPPYAATVGNKAVAMVTRIDDATFRVTGVATGITTMQIRDGNGHTLECELLVKTVNVR